MSRAKLKIAQKLKLKKFRAELNLFVAEGLRLCEMAADFSQVEFGFFTADFLKSARAEKLLGRLEKIAPMYEISERDFEKISDTKTPQGVLLVVRQKFSALEDVLKKFLVVAMDAVHDAGNVGTILRTAEAFGCGVVLLEDSAEIFNPKVVRASMGAIFTLPIIKLSRKEFLRAMKFSGVEVLAAALDTSAEFYFNHDFTKKSAVVFGSEASGVSAEIFGAAEKIFIPMSGSAESLNVATSAAIIISEAARQRAKI